MYCNLNGKILDESNVCISINNRGFRYGDGCFETMKYYSGRLLLSGFHMDRLFESLGVLQFELQNFFTRPFLLQQVDDLVKKNGNEKSARVRLTLFRGDGGLYDAIDLHPNFLIQSWPLEASVNSLNSKGLVAGIYNGGLKAADKFANIKSNNYLLYSQAAFFAEQQGWNDALILNHFGTIADATIANLFICNGNQIITPPLTDGPVNGVMRRWLLGELPHYGFNVSETSINQKDIERAEEAFLTNAVSGIRWIQSIGAKTFKLNLARSIHEKMVQFLFKSQV